MRGEGHIDQGRVVLQLQTKAARQRRKELHEAQLLMPLGRRRLAEHRGLSLNEAVKTCEEGSARGQGLRLGRGATEGPYLLPQ